MSRRGSGVDSGHVATRHPGNQAGDNSGDVNVDHDPGSAELTVSSSEGTYTVGDTAMADALGLLTVYPGDAETSTAQYVVQVG